jgi:peptide/nickel transport system permease protein
MGGYILQRLAGVVLVLVLMSMAIYLLIGLMPGDPIDIMLSGNPGMTPEDAARLRALHGLDRPLWARYADWLRAALTGDFGYSRGFSQPVLAVLWPRLVNTVLLMGISFALAVLIALPVGMSAAVRPQGALDHTVNMVAFAGISVPPFWLAILIIMLFAVWLGWLPAGGFSTVGVDDAWDRARYLALPVTTLTLVTVGGIIRFVRAAVMEVMRQDYVRTARAKGVGEGRLLWRHVLRNAMIPVTTILALNFGTLFSGALITETMFGYLGMGKTIYDAILGNDYNLALVGLLFATLVTLLANLFADLCYVWLDPRIQLD